MSPRAGNFAAAGEAASANSANADASVKSGLLIPIRPQEQQDGHRHALHPGLARPGPSSSHQASPRQKGSEKVNAVACWPYIRSISMWAC